MLIRDRNIPLYETTLKTGAVNVRDLVLRNPYRSTVFGFQGILPLTGPHPLTVCQGRGTLARVRTPKLDVPSDPVFVSRDQSIRPTHRRYSDCTKLVHSDGSNVWDF